MKIKCELDVSPEELLTLFDGNMESLQRVMLELLMKHTAKPHEANESVAAFWQTMSEKSTDMFEQYQQAMNNLAATKDK